MFPNGSERESRIANAHQVLTAAVLKALHERFSSSPGIAIDSHEIDIAAMRLADILRAPEKCFTCGQEVPHA